MNSTKTVLRYLPQTQNRILSACALGFQLSALYLTPTLWHFSIWAFLGYLLVYGYGTVMTWLLIHEAIHYKLLVNRKNNDRVGRAHAITFGCPFHILKIGHMTHHRYNRGDLDTTELIPTDTKRYFLWCVAYYARILGMLYVSEVISPLVFFFWKRAKRIITAVSKNQALSAVLNLFTHRMVQVIQLDAFLCVGFIALQVYLNRFDLRPFLILFLWRGLIVSMYDNAYHYGTDPHDVQAANNLSVPEFIRPVILNHNLHRLHHRYPTASWASLREFEQRDAETFDAPLFSTFFSQLRGPVRRPEKGVPPATEIQSDPVSA